MRYYSSVILIVLHLLLVQSEDDDPDDFFEQFFKARNQPNFLRSTDRPNFFFPSTFKQSIKIPKYIQKSCITEQTCGKWSNQWCCPFHLECGISNGCIQSQLTPTHSQASPYKKYMFSIAIIPIVLIVFQSIYNNCSPNDQGNNLTSNNSRTIMSRERSIQHGSLSTYAVSARQDMVNLEISPRYLITSREQELLENDNHDVIEATPPIFEQQFSTPPPAYDELSRQDSTAIEERSLLPPTYTEFIHSINERKSTD